MKTAQNVALVSAQLIRAAVKRWLEDVPIAYQTTGVQDAISSLEEVATQLEQHTEAFTDQALVVGADRMAVCIDALVRAGTIGSRSPAADAALDYGQLRFPSEMAPFAKMRDELTVRGIEVPR